MQEKLLIFRTKTDEFATLIFMNRLRKILFFVECAKHNLNETTHELNGASSQAVNDANKYCYTTFSNSYDAYIEYLTLS